MRPDLTGTRHHLRPHLRRAQGRGHRYPRHPHPHASHRLLRPLHRGERPPAQGRRRPHPAPPQGPAHHPSRRRGQPRQRLDPPRLLRRRRPPLQPPRPRLLPPRDALGRRPQGPLAARVLIVVVLTSPPGERSAAEAPSEGGRVRVLGDRRGRCRRPPVPKLPPPRPSPQGRGRKASPQKGAPQTWHGWLLEAHDPVLNIQHPMLNVQASPSRSCLLSDLVIGHWVLGFRGGRT